MSTASFPAQNALPNYFTQLLNPDWPWVPSQSLHDRVDNTPEGSFRFKKCEVLRTDPEWDFVEAAFEQQKPTTYKIRRIYYVYREPIAIAFRHHLSRAAETAEAFPPRWRESTDEQRDQRQRIMERWSRIAGPGSESRDVHLLPLWHGSTKEAFEKICKLGFKIRGTGTDEGFFGKGIYFATTAGYAVDAYSKDGHVLLSLVSMRDPFPVTFEDFRQGTPPQVHYPLLGRSGKDDHDAHYIPVVPTVANDPFHTNYEPTRPGQQPMCDEVVVFNENQSLPVFWIELLPTLDLSSVPSYAKGLFYFVLNVLRHEGPENGQTVRKLLKELTKAVHPSEQECVLLIERHQDIAPFSEEDMVENFSSSYVEYCQKAVSSWESLFNAQVHLMAFPTILEKLLPDFDQEDKNGWNKGCELLLTLLSEPEEQGPFPLLKDYIQQHPQTSIAEFALEKVASSETPNEIEKHFPLIEGMAKANLSDDEHQKLYKLLSTRAVLEPLRERYLRQIPPGALFDKLLLTPNRSGYRQKMRLDQEDLKRQIEAVTQTDPSPVRVTSPLFAETRYLKKDLFKDLLDPAGNILRQYGDKPAHEVCQLKKGTVDLHFKQKPSHPMQEYAVYNLTSRISGKGVPPSTLVRFDVELEGQPIKSYPVLVSRTVPGTNFEKINPKTIFEPKHLTHMQMLGLLTRPGDGHASNFIVTDEGEVWCIDNDVSFVDPVMKWGVINTVHFTSILYCLTAKPLDQMALEEWRQLAPDLLFKDWIDDLIVREKTYIDLFSETARRELYKKDKQSLQFTPQLLSKPGLITTLYAQIHLLQELHENPPANGLDLLKHLIVLGSDNQGINALGPYLHRAYEKHFSKPTPSKRLEAATNKNGISISTPDALKATLGTIPTIEEIEKKETFSLGTLQEEFLAFSLLRQQAITIARQNGLESLEVDFSKIKKEGKPDIDRQELMLKALQILVVHHKNPPQKITLAHCAVLTAEKLLPFLHKHLSHLDVRGSSLESVPLEIVDIRLKQLYLTSCDKLTSFEQWGIIWRTALKFPHLEILHINSCSKLTSIQLQASFLQELKATDNSKLTSIVINANLLTCIDTRNSPQVSLYYPEFRVELHQEFCSQLGGYIDCFLEEQDSDQKQRMLGQKLLTELKKQVKDASFPKHFLKDKLEIKDDKMGNKEARALASVLIKTAITSLNLTNNKIENDGAKAIASILDKTAITTLDLGLNFIGDDGAKAIASVLDKTDITMLDLSSSRNGAKAIASALENTDITQLISGSSVGNEGAKAIASVLENTSITQLSLGSSIGEEGARAIASVLEKTNITLLSLKGINTEGAKAIASVLEKTDITCLCLGSNIGDEGAKAIASVLEKTDIKWLALEGISDEGAKVIASVLEKTAITWLDLWHNNIGDEGAKAIASVLENTAITWLNLSSNNIGDKGAWAIASVLEKTVIRWLYLKENRIGKDTYNSITEENEYVLSDEQKRTFANLKNKNGETIIAEI